MRFLTLSHVQMEHIKIYQSTDCLIGFERFLRLRRKLTKFMVSGTNCTNAGWPLHLLLWDIYRKCILLCPPILSAWDICEISILLCPISPLQQDIHYIFFSICPTTPLQWDIHYIFFSICPYNFPSVFFKMLVILRISKLHKRIFSFTKSGLINEIKVLADAELVLSKSEYMTSDTVMPAYLLIRAVMSWC